jgi:cell division transport system permease protein
MKREFSLRRQFITFQRIFFTGLKNVFRNAWLAVAAMAVMFVALTIILFAVVLNITASNAIDELSKNLKVSIYLEDNVDEVGQRSLEQALRQSDAVDNVEYISKQVAQQRFAQSFSSDQDLLDGLSLVGADTLPASFEVSATSLDRFSDIEAVALQEQFDGIVESITLGRTDARRTIERAASAQQFLTTASIFAAVVFTVISMLIIFNTIRIAIFTRSEEIHNMKLIGATPGYIRGPFLVEASIYGVIAGMLASGAVYLLIVSIGSKIAGQAEFQYTYELLTEPSNILAGAAATILVGILVGMFSSALAMEKYLRLKRW